jgi:hypothetical protein
MATDPDAGDTAHNDREPTDEYPRLVEVPLTDADIERIELEIEQNKDAEYASESVEEWIQHAVYMLFARIDLNTDRVKARPKVDVPPVMARRAQLEAESARQRGKDTSIEDILLENVGFHPTYCVDGEPIVDEDDHEDEDDAESESEGA